MADEAEFTAALDQWERTLRLYSDATGKTAVEALNKKAPDIAFAAVRETPAIALSVLTKYNPAKRGKGRGDPAKRPKNLMFAITAGEAGSRQANADREWKKRRRSKGSLKAAWLAVAKKSGRPVRQSVGRDLLNNATFRPADLLSKKVILETNPRADNGGDARVIESKMIGPMTRAVRVVAGDMEEYSNRKLGIVADEHSALGARG